MRITAKTPTQRAGAEKGEATGSVGMQPLARLEGSN